MVVSMTSFEILKKEIAYNIDSDTILELCDLEVEDLIDMVEEHILDNIERFKEYLGEDNE